MWWLRKKRSQSEKRRVSHSESSTKYSYYQNRDDSGRSQRGAPSVSASRQSRVAFLSHIPVFIAGACIILCLIYIMTLASQANVIVVNEQNQAVQSLLRDSDVYELAVAEELANSPFNRTKLTINTDAIAEGLHKKFPEATDIAVTLPLLGRRPVVYMRIAEPVINLSASTGNYAVDEKGRAVIALDNTSNFSEIKLLRVIDQTGLDIQDSQQALPRYYVEFIQEVNTQLSAAGLMIDEMILPPLAHELHVSLDGIPYFIKFDVAGDAREQAGAFIATWQQMGQRGISPAEYVDVRVEERVYYR